ncbi:MAG: hypothetical protein ABIS36_25870 [Chryseolinea sp.]
MTDASKILVEWANSQPNWIKVIVKEVIDSGRALPPAFLDTVFDFFMIEKDLVSGESTIVENLISSIESTNQEEKFFLKRLGDIENVNRLTSGQEILFNEGITIFFGENASGKSGYVRILKKLAATRSQEEILPDVTKLTPSGNPKANISYSTGGNNLNLTWSGESGISPFNRLNIFDNRSLLYHVDSDLTYVVTPRELSLFKFTHEAVDSIKARLDFSIKDKKINSNPFTIHFQKDSNIYSKIESLGASTDLRELEELSKITSDEEAIVSQLKDQVEALRPQVVSSKLEAMESRRTLLQQGVTLANVVSSFDWGNYNQLISSLKIAKEKYSEATEKAFIGHNIPGFLSESWKNLIDAGSRYVKEAYAGSYPKEGDTCIYCQQPLELAAIDLLSKYDSYCNDALKTEITKIEVKLQVLATALNFSELETYKKTVLRKMENTQSQNRDLLELKLKLIDGYNVISNQCKVGDIIVTDEVNEHAIKVHELSQDLLSQTETLIKDLKKQGEERNASLTQVSTKLKNIESRLILKQFIQQIKSYVEDAKWVHKAENVINTFSNILRSLTAQTKIASEDLINKDFQTLFESESKALKAPAVKLDFPGQKGQAARRKSLSSRYRLSDILSEGEQKVIAIADFLAETSIRKNSSPIIFDDPVNSLDYKRMNHIVERIHQLSNSQQIIIFTHNIWFATALLAQYEKNNRDKCSYYDIAESAGQPGFIRSGTHPRWDTTNNIKTRINKMVQDASNLSGESQQALVESIYDVLRGWCEVVVEQDLFNKVAQRYSPHVAMSQLVDIKVDRLKDAINVILPLYNKCCRYMPGHSQPLETLGIRPSIEELTSDWALVQDALRVYKG